MGKDSLRAEARRKTASLRALAARALEAPQEVADVADATLGPGHAEKRHEEEQRVPQRVGDREDDQRAHRSEERQLAGEENTVEPAVVMAPAITVSPIFLME